LPRSRSGAASLIDADAATPLPSGEVDNEALPMDLRPADRIIVALDVPTLDAAMGHVRALAGRVGAFKVGLELLTSAGAPQVVSAIHAAGGRVFFDGKFCDIPNTIRGAATAASAMGVWMFDVHASSGSGAVAAAAAAKGGSLLVAVTVLTSMDDAESGRVFGAPARTRVVEFARMARSAGADGVVCSGAELPLLRADPALQGLLTVVPGVRPAWAETGDQARVLTPGGAVKAGADYLVIGRPILKPPASIGGPAEAASAIADEIAAAAG
jgi:orotidine-5'-phosphate decarboxylase